MVKASSLTTVGNLHFLNNKKDSPSQTAGRCNSLAQSRMAWRHLRNYQKVGNSNIELWARVVMKKIDEELDEGELHMDLKLTNIGGIWRGIDSTAISSKSDDFISFILSPFLSHFKGRIAPLAISVTMLFRHLRHFEHMKRIQTSKKKQNMYHFQQSELNWCQWLFPQERLWRPDHQVVTLFKICCVVCTLKIMIRWHVRPLSHSAGYRSDTRHTSHIMARVPHTLSSNNLSKQLLSAISKGNVRS